MGAPSPVGEGMRAGREALLVELSDLQWHSREVMVVKAQQAGNLQRGSAYELTRVAIRDGVVQKRRVQGVSGRVYEQLALPGVPNDRAGEVVPKRSPRRGRPAQYRRRESP